MFATNSIRADANAPLGLVSVGSAGGGVAAIGSVGSEVEGAEGRSVAGSDNPADVGSGVGRGESAGRQFVKEMVSSMVKNIFMVRMVYNYNLSLFFLTEKLYQQVPFLVRLFEL